MAKIVKKRRKKPIMVLGVFLFLCVVLFIVPKILDSIGKDGNSTDTNVREAGETVYVCSGCGHEYIGYFPITDEEPLSVYTKRQITQASEAEDNDSIAGATNIPAFSWMTGNLSIQEDVDFYSFTVNTAGTVELEFSGSGQSSYMYTWEVTIYGTDGVTVLKSGTVESKEAVSNYSIPEITDPGTYYLRITVSKSLNPFLNGYSDEDYHIAFTSVCTVHPSETKYTIKQPTCTQPGERISVCDECDTIVSTEEIEASGHIWSEWMRVKGDTGLAFIGEESRTCARCGETETEISLAHHEKKTTEARAVTTTVVKKPTCTDSGISESLCAVCGYIERKNLEATGHTYGGWTTKRVPTCSVAGERSRVCGTCGKTEKESVEMLSHHYGDPVRVSGSILDAPIVSLETCKDCGYVNRTEDNRYGWVLPALIVAGIVSAILITILPAVFIGTRIYKKTHKTHFVCPYCFETHKIAEARRTPATNKVFCPSCKSQLPESTLSGEDMIISIVGSRNTGKSNFVGVLINELIERIAPAFGGSFEGFKDTMTRYERDFKNKLYVGLQRIEQTSRPLGESYTPLIFSLKFRAKKGGRKALKSYTLVFFDTAGEDLNEKEETMSRVNKYICKSAGIIFLLDPTRIPKVKQQLDPDVIIRAGAQKGNAAARADDILVKVSNLIRDDKGLSGSDKIDVPVAVVFSKFDVIEPLVPRGFAILENSPHCKENAFVLRDGHNVDSEVKGLLRSWEAKSFLAQLDLNYTDYSCFAVSALGLHNNPAIDGKINPPSPHRIEDPMLWLLMKLKVIKSRK